MRRDLLCATVAAFLLIPASALAHQQGQNQNQSQQGQTPAPAPAQTASSSSSQSTGVAPAAPVDPLVAAARKAREQKKDQPKPARVFDNDNIPTQGGVSAVGSAPEAESTEGGATAEAGGAPAKAAAPSGTDETAWREKFAKLRKKLEQDQADLEIMQRELGVLDVQYYNDPMKGMQQGYTRSDINDKTTKIDDKKKQIEADQQAISDAEDELHKSGGDPGWAR